MRFFKRDMPLRQPNGARPLHPEQDTANIHWASAVHASRVVGREPSPHVRKAMKRRDKSEFDPPPSEGAPQSEDAFARGAGSTADEFETEDPGDADSATEAPVPFSDLERRLADQEEKYLRLAAEYDNYRKRTARERSELTTRAQAELAKQLVDALDDLARFAHVDPSP